MTTSSNHRPTSVRSQLTKLVHVQFRQFICWPTKSTDFSCHMANFCQPMTKNRSSDIDFSGRVELNGESYLPWSRLQRHHNYDMPVLLWLAKWHWWKYCLNHRREQYGRQSSRLTAEDLLCILWISASLWLREVPWLMWWMTQHSILPFWYTAHLLLEHGSDTSHCSNQGDDALQCAAVFGRADILEQLVGKLKPTPQRWADACSWSEQTLSL